MPFSQPPLYPSLDGFGLVDSSLGSVLFGLSRRSIRAFEAALHYLPTTIRALIPFAVCLVLSFSPIVIVCPFSLSLSLAAFEDTDPFPSFRKLLTDSPTISRFDFHGHPRPDRGELRRVTRGRETSFLPRLTLTNFRFGRPIDLWMDTVGIRCSLERKYHFERVF